MLYSDVGGFQFENFLHYIHRVYHTGIGIAWLHAASAFRIQYGMLGIMCLWIINLMLRVNEIEIRQFVWDSELFFKCLLLLLVCVSHFNFHAIFIVSLFLIRIRILFVYEFNIIFLCVSHPSCFWLKHRNCYFISGLYFPCMYTCTYWNTNGPKAATIQNRCCKHLYVANHVLCKRKSQFTARMYTFSEAISTQYIRNNNKPYKTQNMLR